MHFHKIILICITLSFTKADNEKVLCKELKLKLKNTFVIRKFRNHFHKEHFSVTLPFDSVLFLYIKRTVQNQMHHQDVATFPRHDYYLLSDFHPLMKVTVIAVQVP